MVGSATERLWSAFCEEHRNLHPQNPCSHHRFLNNHVNSANHQRKSLFGGILSGFTVHAAEAESPDETSVEKLARKAPQIIITEDDINEYLEVETGKERLVELFTRRDGTFHPDLQRAISSTQLASSTILIMTSYFGSRAAAETYLLKNKHKKFETKFKAMRPYYDAVIMGGIKFGFTWAVKSFAFIGIFLIISQSISTYRNKTNPLDYACGAGISGAIMRSSLGVRGMAAGGLIGGGLGGAAGLILFGLQRLTGETQERIHYWRTEEKIRHNREMELLAGKSPRTIQNTLATPLPS